MEAQQAPNPPPPTSTVRRLIGRISRLEWLVAGVTAVILAGLVVIEPAIVEAPFETSRTLIFTVGGTVIAAVALVVMLQLRVWPVVRVVALGLPFVAVSWWLLWPFFLDSEVNDDFGASIAAAGEQPTPAGATDSAAEAPGSGATTTIAGSQSTDDGPVLRGAGQFVGLAGHEGTGDAGFFVLADGSVVLRLENLDIQNGPDLRLYVVPGAAQTSPDDDALYLGKLRGNVGNQTYELPADFDLMPGDWTVLVWCEAFSVEFVAATVTVT